MGPRAILGLTLFAVLLCGALGQDQSSFLFYQNIDPNSPLTSIYQQNFIVFLNDTGYAFILAPLQVYVTDLVPYLNASQTDPPPTNNPFPSSIQKYTITSTGTQPNLGPEGAASVSYYASRRNESNTGFYIPATNYVLHINPVNWTLSRWVPIPHITTNSVALVFTFVDGSKMYAPVQSTQTLYVYDLETFTTNSTQSYNLSVSVQTDFFDPTSRVAIFFGTDGSAQVWNLDTQSSGAIFSVATGLSASQYAMSLASGDIARGLLYVACQKTVNGSSISYPVLQVFNISDILQNSNGTVSLLYELQLSDSSDIITSLYLDNVGGQAFVGTSDGNTGQWNRIDLLRRTIAEPVSVAQTSQNGKIALNYLLGVQNQSAVLYTESAINVFEYPTTCPNDCTSSVNGYCNYGTCNCYPGWTSDDCSQIACSSDCGVSQGHGQCNNGICLCTASWTGANCSTIRCPFDCSGNGVCLGPSSNYTCSCGIRYSGDGCQTPRQLNCPEISDAAECVGRTGECGWCQSERKCMYGNNIGPVYYACPDWYTDNPKDNGIMAFAIIYIIICCILVVINVITALIIDHQNATELISTKRLQPQSIRRNWWRDERSNMGWTLFEQLQFIALYGIVTVGYSTRILSFTRYFEWTCFVIPLPGYFDYEVHSERSTARATLDYEQFGNGNDSGIQQVWYSQIVWAAIAFGGFTVVHLIYAFVASIIRGSASKEVFFSRVLHMIFRMLNIAYYPFILVAASHTRYGYKSIAGSIIFMIIFGFGLPALSIFFTYDKQQLLFKYGWRAKFGVFYSTFHFKLPYFQPVILLRKAIIGLLIGFMAAPLNQPTLAFGQVCGPILVMIVYIVIIAIKRPYLDKVHLLLDVGLNVLNIFSIGMALTNYASPSLIGDIIFLLLQILGLLFVVGAYIHCWLAMESVNCCSPPDDEKNNTSELATLKI